MPPASAVQDLGLNFLLGAEYERRKQKLQQELQLDYKQHVSKKHDVKSSEHYAQPETLSLPIEDRTTVKEKLREERNKEYNLFLQKQAQNRKLKRGSLPRSSTPVQHSNQKSPLSLAIELRPPEQRPPSRRDAETLTEAVDNGTRRRPWVAGHRPRRRWQIYRLRDSYYSEEELDTDGDEEFDYRYRTRNGRQKGEPAQEERRSRSYKERRASGDIKKTDDCAAHNPSSSDKILDSELEMTGDMRTTSRSAPGVSKEKAELATGLMIGAAEDKTATQMRKEQYKQELLKQIAEQQESKINEKRLELRVAATGATDPEKKPDRIKHLGAVNLRHDNSMREVLSKPAANTEVKGENPKPRPQDGQPNMSRKRASFGNSLSHHRPAPSQLPGNTAPGSGTEGVPSLDYFSPDYHREFSNVLGEMAVPRVAAFDPPPVPPILPERYTTPYDAAYDYFGTRNPLEPNLPHNHGGPPRVDHLSGDVVIPSQKSSHPRSSGHNEVTPHNLTSCLEIQDKPEQRRESLLSYQEALKQQIKEKEEQKRRAREEKERYDAKIEAEMMAYNPWGRSGGGAPIRDQHGDIFSDLSQMHRFNEDAYRNFSCSRQATAPPSRRTSDFKDEPSTQQFNTQSKYKEALKQQIEEKKRKQEEERERIRIREENEEKKLAEQRARITQQYEEEQRKQEEIKAARQRGVPNQSWIHQLNSPQHEVRKMARQEKEREEEPQRTEEKVFQFNYEERNPSPPVPALQRKPTYVESRPLSVESQLSSKTARTISAPRYRAETQKAQDKEEVFRELSALRRHLRNEQRHLEAQMAQRSQPETRYASSGRRRPRADAFESSQKEPERRTAPLTATLRVNTQNIREFNQLKYRDTFSREEVRTMFPDPPADAQTLDIQQQALLREQQRKIRLMNRKTDHGFLDDEEGLYYPRKTLGRSTHNEPPLESETTIFDFYGGDGYDGEVQRQRPSQPSAERRDRTATRRRPKCDEPADPPSRHEKDFRQTDTQSLQSAASLKSSEGRAGSRQHNMRRDLKTGERKCRTGGLRDDELDDLSLGSVLERRVSVETVATEPWLRPGTSDAVKQRGQTAGRLLPPG